jgi:hypothetical protein
MTTQYSNQDLVKKWRIETMDIETRVALLQEALAASARSVGGDLGMDPVHSSLATLYAALDLAGDALGSYQAGIEWMRNALALREVRGCPIINAPGGG